MVEFIKKDQLHIQNTKVWKMWKTMKTIELNSINFRDKIQQFIELHQKMARNSEKC